MVITRQKAAALASMTRFIGGVGRPHLWWHAGCYPPTVLLSFQYLGNQEKPNSNTSVFSMFKALHHSICWRAAIPSTLLHSKSFLLGSQMGLSTTSSHMSKLLFRQLFEKESSTYTYLLADVSHPDKPALVSFLASVCLSSLFSEGKGKGKLMNGFWIFFFLVFCYVSLFGFAFLVEDPFKKSAFFAFSGFYCCLNGGSWGHTGKEKKRNWSSMVWDIVNCTGKRLCLIIWPRWVDFCFLSGDGKPKMSNFLSFLGNRAELW